jgi:hypothetical protein
LAATTLQFGGQALDFKFDFDIPEPRKDRIIVKRDERGRIVKNEPLPIAVI